MKKKLTKTEEDIMQYLWDLEAATVSQIIEQMPDPKPPHSTVSSIVRILEKKGFVSHNAYGRTYEYYPLIAKEDYSHKTINHFVRDYFDGSMKRMVSFLIEEKEIELEELQDMIESWSVSEGTEFNEKEEEA